MKVRCRLADVRKQRGLSAAQLAELAGVRRQTIYSIEDGTFTPNTVIALRLARALDVKVEELFSLDEPREETIWPADLVSKDREPVEPGQPVRLCELHGRLIAIPVSPLPAFLPPADGVLQNSRRGAALVRVSMGMRPGDKRLLIAGCDPALSLLTEFLEPSRFEVVTVSCSSRTALNWLKKGRVHVAGSHLRDPATGDYNVPFVRRLFPKGVRLVHFAAWEQGLVLARSNPREIRSIADLSRRKIGIVNREKGSGSRDLLDTGLAKAGISPAIVRGYDRIAHGHLEAALAVSLGTADCCIATHSAAAAFGLHFIPLAIERFDLCMAESMLESLPVRALLDAVAGSRLRRKLEAIAQCDARRTGEVLL